MNNTLKSSISIGIAGGIAFASGFAFGSTEADSTSEVKTATETNLVVEKQMDSAQCIRIGDADHDPTIFNMKWNGWEIDYDSGTWIVGGEIVETTAESEDAAFFACGPTWLITTMDMYQRDAIAAGADVFGTE